MNRLLAWAPRQKARLLGKDYPAKSKRRFADRYATVPGRRGARWSSAFPAERMLPRRREGGEPLLDGKDETLSRPEGAATS